MMGRSVVCRFCDVMSVGDVLPSVEILVRNDWKEMATRTYVAMDRPCDAS
jgi:hypothetical protein